MPGNREKYHLIYEESCINYGLDFKLSPRVDCENFSSVLKANILLESLFLILHVFVEPFEHLGQHMEDGFSGSVAVALIGKHNQSCCGSMALQGVIEPLGLDRESS